ncbi:MAG TPA: transglycosylase SLT domain-containing protein [Candidatus Acidoferrales bacterium]|nr:transglycosylase SLT domain-containing protein [Candidatus Acidoferrales bacterium]
MRRCAASTLLCAWILLGPARAGAQGAGAAPNAAADELATLSRAMRDRDTPANFQRLAEFAREHENDSAGPLAALALGYRDYTHNRSAEAAAWFSQAEQGTLLADYVLYWEAQNARGEHRTAAALDLLDRIVHDHPSSAILPQALEALAGIALEQGDARRARYALEDFQKTPEHSGLLLLRARARELDRALSLAAADYVAVYYRFPLSAEAKRAGERLDPLRHELRTEFPEITPEMRLARAAAFYDARQWRQARAEYQAIAKVLTGAERERALLRAAASAVGPHGGPGPLEQLHLSDADLDAERFSLLAEAYHRKKKTDTMERAAESAVSRAPRSNGAATALFEVGNYFWSSLDRETAAAYYKRSLDASLTSAAAETAKWRLAWTAYLDRDANAATLFEEHVRQFPTSSYLPEAIYWLGRLAERSGDAARARTFFLKVAGRFPQTYWGSQARARLQAIGPGNETQAEQIPVLALVAPPKPLPELSAPLPAAAAVRDARARALAAIGFDASADLEWRLGYAETGNASLLVSLAQAALADGRYPLSIVTIRQAIPQLEARRWEELPLEVWAAAFPMPYAAQIRSAAASQGIDPMLVAGLIRQESAFQPHSVSRAKAIGLMQVLPGTGKRLARELRIPYSRSKLFEPDYNLRLGTRYLADLVAMFGSEEPALAAYDAGEDRIAGWQAERKYDEMAEFIESIPITETREYVQIVSRNASIYRRLGSAQQ